MNHLNAPFTKIDVFRFLKNISNNFIRSTCYNLPIRYLILLLGCFLLSCITVRAEKPAAAPSLQTVTIQSVKVGFDGLYKVGHWTPVRIKLLSGSKPQVLSVRITVLDSDSSNTTFTTLPEQPITIPATSQAEVAILVKYGRSTGSMLVELLSAEPSDSLSNSFEEDKKTYKKVLFKKTFSTQAGPNSPNYFPKALPATNRLILNLLQPTSLEAFAKSQNPRSLSRTHIAHLNNPAELPSQWIGYDGVDLIVLPTANLQRSELLAADDLRLKAIQKWIQQGGRLLFSCGINASKLIQPDMPLAKFVPGKYHQSVSLRSLVAISQYCQGEAHIQAPQYPIPRFTDIQGNIEIYEGNRITDFPLLIHTPFGLGETIFSAIDLDRAPFSEWSDRTKFYATLLSEERTKEERLDTNYSGSLWLGYHDMTGQIHAALDQFNEVGQISFAVVALLIVFYIILIGPLDYWLVKYLFKRMEATWITFPLTIVIVCLLTYYSIGYLKGNEILTNQLELIDIDLASGQTRGTAWTNIYSPKKSSYNLQAKASLPEKVTISQQQTYLSYTGLPGIGIRGMSSQDSSMIRSTDSYDHRANLKGLSRVPIPVWSSKMFQTRFTGKSKTTLTAQLSETSDAMLDGQITNHLGIKLHDARLYYDRWVYNLEDFKNSSTVAIGSDYLPAPIETILQKKQISGDQSIEQAYSTANLNIDRIIEVLMFHQAAGGPKYTAGLINRMNWKLDLSRQLSLGKAVLVGRIETPVTKLLNNKQALTEKHQKNWTYLRILIPVDRFSHFDR